jgi:hypothetical protein
MQVGGQGQASYPHPWQTPGDWVPSLLPCLVDMVSALPPRCPGLAWALVSYASEDMPSSLNLDL